MFSWIKRHENSESEIWATWRILADLVQRFPGVWLPQAAACRTLLPHSRPLAELSLPQAMNDFILRYEPKAKSGIYEHQAQILVAACQTTAHLILTSGTGSGKSLCFLSFVLESLSRSLQATALICLPTQALLWGQAERLAALSTDCSYNHAGQAMAGRLVVAGHPICWTIWKGSQDDTQMQRHQGTSAFGRARLRLATIDKVHFSLLREGTFFRQLAVMVLDEAHQYQGVFGAQVAYLIKRIAVLKEVFSLSPVRFFLASATLPQPIDFASRLLSVPKSAILYIDGSATETVEFISLAAAKSFLKQREAALKRIVLFYDRQPGRPELTSLLTAKPLRHSRALYFCQSKAMSRRLRLLLKPHLAQPVLLYDADLLPEERRELEQTFRHHVERPLLLIATNALELGVDIGGLDVCLLPNLTLGQAAFQQRLGRVGRAVTRPGLVIAGLGVSPWEAALKQHLTALFLPRQTPLPLPLALPALKERSLLLAGSEKDLQSAAFTVRVKPQGWRAACKRIYGCEPAEREAQAKAARMSRRLYDGFRGPQERKVELIASGTKEPIAFMARHCLLARGHAGAIYIDELSHFWQVLPASFQQRAEGATGSYPFASALVDRLLLAPLAERAYITAGIVHGQVRFVRPLADPIDSSYQYDQSSADLVYGLWEKLTTVKSYRRLTLAGREVGVIALAPPLHLCEKILCLGWRWQLPPVETANAALCLREMKLFMETVFAGFLAQSAQVGQADCSLIYSAKNRLLLVLDNDRTNCPALSIGPVAVCEALQLSLQALKLSPDLQNPAFRAALREITDTAIAYQILTQWLRLWEKKKIARL